MASEGSPQVIFEPNRHLQRLSCASARWPRDFATYLKNYCYIHAEDVGIDKPPGEVWGEGERGRRTDAAAQNVFGPRETEPQFLAALDKNVRAPIAQGGGFGIL